MQSECSSSRDHHIDLSLMEVSNLFCVVPSVLRVLATNDIFVQVCLAWNAGNELSGLVFIRHQKCMT